MTAISEGPIKAAFCVLDRLGLRRDERPFPSVIETCDAVADVRAALLASQHEVERLRADALRTARMDEESVNTIQELQAKVERVEGELLTAYMAGQESVQQANAALAKDAAIGRVVFRYIDRMNDAAPESGDPAERILAEFVAAVSPAIDAALEGQPQ